MASVDAGGAEFQPFLALKFPSVRKGTVVRDVTLSTKLKVRAVSVALPDVSSRWWVLEQRRYRVRKCDVIKMKFLKLWDLSGYSKRTMPKRSICQK